jgi:hypothetical protein
MITGRIPPMAFRDALDRSDGDVKVVMDWAA